MVKNIYWHDHKTSRLDREKLLGQKAFLVWFTGLSGSGKSTLASALQQKLIKEDKLTYILDGDNVRHGINTDLDFSEEGRSENIRRIGEISKLFVDAGIIIMSAFISPYIRDRSSIREKVSPFVEIYVKCAVDKCEKRDPKGLYKKARKGEIDNFTGVNSPYEEPKNPEIVVDSSKLSVEECVTKIYSFLVKRKLI